MPELIYLAGYSETLRNQVRNLIADQKLGDSLVQRYPQAHEVTTDKSLYNYTIELKNHYLRNTQPLAKVSYDSKIQVVKHALGTHTVASRLQGNKLKAKAEIRIATLFKRSPEALLRMIVVHELAHLKEKDHNKAFYALCQHMEPNYFQLEFDTRLYMTQLMLFGPLYT